MKVREFEFDKDVGPIDAIFQRQPELGIPSLYNVLDNAIIEKEDGSIAAYGVVKIFAEGVLIMNRDFTRKREKAEVVLKMINRAIEACKAQGIEKFIVISNDNAYTKVLKKRFGFERMSGETLFLELDNQNG